MVRDATTAWSALTDDPVGVLLPAAGALLVDVVLALGVRSQFGGDHFLAACAVALCVRPFLQSPFRAAMLAAGAHGNADAGVLSSARLAIVDAIRGAVSLIVGFGIAAPFLLASAWLTTRGLYLFAAGALGVGALIGASLSLLVRAALAYTPVDVIVGRVGAVEAFRRAWNGLSADVLPTAGLLLLGDLATGLGGALCGAGALPGYPLGELALISRWQARRAAA